MHTLLLRTAELRAVEARYADAAPPLMERAGRAAAEFAGQLLQDRRAPVLVFAGPGNNGGDARVVARVLREQGIQVVIAGADGKLPAGNFGLVVDGLFGIGLARPISGAYVELIARINAFRGPVLALDIPSGLDGDSGRVMGVAVRATHTLSFIGGKPGLYTLDGPDHCGEVSVANLGLQLDEFPGALLALDDFHECLRPRARNSHKGSFGSLAVIGGAAGMTGAALLAARAGLQLGAGRTFAGLLQALAVDPLQAELMLRSPENALAQAMVAVIGPGLGASDAALEILRRTASADFPVLLDADALNLLATHPVLAARIARRSAPTIITPHPAEAARLLATTTEAVQADRVGTALNLAQRFKAHVALKGCGTVIAHPDGRWRINTTGNPGLASGGSGDVLAGMAGALLAQGWPAAAALSGAVYLHGAAADALAAAGNGPIGIAAGELIQAARTLFNRLIAANA
ncbi:MAG: NAD(P)H-hydrate dehydratase [Rhodocyclales bacterium RIFCSPLOWO2_02_FULL_63_24]|nr:MAG: NAD(P)H-hydrate dehydratase [Rhodocyclales bacterium RIFCSPLOWO2_02_FULL_63_24]